MSNMALRLEELDDLFEGLVSRFGVFGGLLIDLVERR